MVHRYRKKRESGCIDKKVIECLENLQAWLFRKLAARQPEQQFRLGAEAYIAIPDETSNVKVPDGVSANLQHCKIRRFYRQLAGIVLAGSYLMPVQANTGERDIEAEITDNAIAAKPAKDDS